jgi:leader peptidase (prepilin peptidase) / N-methyltransferase
VLSGAPSAWIAAVALAVLLTQLAAIAVVDWRRMIIPDALNALLFATGVASSMLTGQPSPLSAAAAATAGAAVLYGVRHVVSRRTGREAMGLGDVKFMAGAGAWVGLEALPALLVVASLAGLAWGLRPGARDAQDRIPFGPFLALGTAAARVLQATGLLG